MLQIATFLLALGAALAPATWAQGVHVGLVPADTSVALGATFELHLEVTQAGSSFNAYDAVVTYDPAALTFVQMSPLVLQEGSGMRNVCGSTFHIFNARNDSLIVTHVLLCANQFLTGPVRLYNLRFQAATTDQVTQVHIAFVQFYRAGFSVGPAFPSDARVQIGTPTEVNALPAPRLRLWAAPNPCNPSTTAFVEAPASGWQRLTLCDVAGRQLRVLQAGRFEAGVRRVPWDGLDAGGTALPSGVYVLRLEAPRLAASTRLVLVR